MVTLDGTSPVSMLCIAAVFPEKDLWENIFRQRAPSQVESNLADKIEFQSTKIAEFAIYANYSHLAG